MKWNHIMEKQPEDGQSIIQIDAPYEGHYPMGMRKYVQGCSWEEVLEYYSKNDWGNPNFWWISAREFPFPDQPDSSKREDCDFEKLADIFYNTQITKEDVVNWEEEAGALKVLEKFANWLNQRCGALNTDDKSEG